MTDTQAVSTMVIRHTLKEFGPSAAEQQLVLIGSNVGDEHLSLVVADLLPGEVAAIVGIGDYTKPSITVHFISPEQFLGALERFGSKWGKIGNSQDTIIRLKSELADFVLSITLHAEGLNQEVLIRALADHSLGEDVLVALPLKEHGCPEFFEEFNPHMAQKGTWQELYAVIQGIDESLFDSLRGQVARLFQKFDSENEPVVHPTDRFLKRTLQALSREAARHAGQENLEDEKKTEEVFDI